MGSFQIGDFLFGYPIISHDADAGVAEIRLPQQITITIGYKETAGNIANLLRQWGIWIPQTTL